MSRPFPHMPNAISKTIMWLGWMLMALLSVLMGHYLTKGVPKLNTFSRPFEVFATGMFVIPIVICGGLRFWLSYIRNPWLALFPFLIGIFFAQQAGLYGVYLVPEFCIIFQILSAVLFALYLPLFVRLRPPDTITNKPASLTKGERRFRIHYVE